MNIFGLELGLNGLPYPVPIHPMLVHFTIGLFLIAVLFDILATLYRGDSSFVLKLPIGREGLYDVGWWNLLAAAGMTFLTVAVGFFELFLARVPEGTSAWGLSAYNTLLLHGLGGVLLLTFIVLLAVWRGLQRYIWRRGQSAQVQWGYLLTTILVAGLMLVQGELGGHLGYEFGIHNTTVNNLQQSRN